MKRWIDLSKPEDKYIQCPFTILNLNINPKSLKLYLILWQEAFVNKKRKKGVHYAEMTYEQMQAELFCSQSTLLRCLNELIEHKLIIKKKDRTKNIFFFTTKGNWE